MTSFQSVFCSSLYCLLTLVFVRYSSFYFSLFLFSIVFPSLCSIYSSPYQTPFRVFSRLAPHLLSSFSLWSLSLSISSLFSLETLSPQTWIMIISSVWKSFSSEYRCFASLLEIAKYQESLFNNLTSMISRSKHGLQILSLRCFTSSNQHETFLGFYKHLWSWILSLFSLSSLRWDILVLACLRLNQTLAAHETDTRQISYFSGQSCHDHWNLV